MKVERIADAEIPLVRRLHDRMGMPYPFPALDGPLYCLKMKAIGDKNDVVAACAVKLVGEAFVWCDQERPAVEQMRGIRALAGAGAAEAAAIGLEEVSAWIPPAVEPRFGRALGRLGWVRSPWQSWTRVL